MASLRPYTFMAPGRCDLGWEHTREQEDAATRLQDVRVEESHDRLGRDEKVAAA
jgi:hypothetical protein